MNDALPSTIHIAAALIADPAGRILLVRKAGTEMFMQAGGKIQGDESAIQALGRELREELGLDLDGCSHRLLGNFRALAAHEAGCMVEARLFHVEYNGLAAPRAEIEEARWLSLAEAEQLPLAPLTRIHVLPLAARLG